MNAVSHPLSIRQADWAVLNLALMWIYEGPVPEDGHGWRKNLDLAAWLILAGDARVECPDGDVHRARSGEWMFLPGGTRLQFFAEETRLLSLTWRARWPDGRNFFAEGLPVTLSAPEHPQLESRARALAEFSKQELECDPRVLQRSRASVGISPGVFFRGEILLLEWMAEVTSALGEARIVPRIHDIPDSRVLLALDLLENHPLNQPYRTEDVARRVGLSSSQLNRLFTQFLGHTPKAHFQRRRIRAAKTLVMDDELPIKEISYQLGFASQHVFYNWFRRQFGCAPSAFQGKAAG